MNRELYYQSTRDASVRVTASQAISQGISEEGGLFVPCRLPAYTKEEIAQMQQMGYAERAAFVLKDFLTDFTNDEIRACVEAAYAPEKFENGVPAPVVTRKDGTHMLELWHGPTCAFKDMALQLLPHLLTVSLRKQHPDTTAVILVATSGDTGKAALEGFKNVDHTRILVFYPQDGVSPMQKRQMVTQDGQNVEVCAIHGNFDDAQTGVKKIFTDPEIRHELMLHDQMFSSANSINWGRLLPQIVYYFSAYADLLAAGKIENGDPINVVVPTGNFGNILAAYYAGRMGLPLNKLICASNANNVLTDFITTGTYDRNRDFHTTASPSMDILVSSNLERLLFHLSGASDLSVRTWMKALSETGSYTVDPATLRDVQARFAAGFCDDAATAEVIGRIFREEGYLCDTHTAVAVRVYEDYRAKTGDTTPTVIASTANPYKFADHVLAAIGGEPVEDEFENVRRLHERSGLAVPPQLADLADRTVRFTRSIDAAQMKDTVLSLLA